MSWFGSTFDKNKLKANLKMAISRMDLQRNKKQNSVKLQKRQIAELLQQEKDESARIKVESIIREDYQVEAFDILQLFCDLLQTRMQLIVESKSCPHDLKEAVSSLVYAAPRLEIPELLEVRKQFVLKYGKEFVENASENKDLAVNPRVIFKLGIKVPEPILCVRYLKEIATEHNIEWDDSSIKEPEQTMQAFPQQQAYSNQMMPMPLPMQPPQQPIPPQIFMAPPQQQPMPYSQPPQYPMQQPPVLHSQGPTLPGYVASGFDPNQAILPPNLPPQQPLLQFDGPALPSNAPLTGINPPMTFGSAVAAPDVSPDSYDFDELQKRFEALKKRE